ncbi:substrate-binding domain-containing protein [Paenibacillus sp. HWE-109]|uniref:substrate-binding domain-containing protein n=1 Tax=Paenibacillus sp. HWE-109 TaxID=1306526 RepID=UPI001EDF6A8C|nr:substrate-binding domain-containing protein [Paenibacillus sp. HWE-109]UKS24806.1 substrate-binding domain-containing protein [Paenibacillus sp. HWE-109]
MHLKKPVIWAVLLAITVGFVVVIGMEMLRITNPKKLEIAIVLKTNNIRSDYWQMVRSGAEEAAKEYAVNLDIRGPLSESDTAAQIRSVDEALAKKPDAIILAASDYDALSSAAEKITKSGTKLILIDSPVRSHPEASLIMTDNTEAGRQAGLILAEGQNDSLFRVMTLSSGKESLTEKERQDGCQAAFAAFPGVAYAGNFELAGTEDEVYEQVKNLLAMYPDIQGIAAMNETATLGAARAVKEMKRGNRTKIVGFDSSIYQIKLLEEGILKAEIVKKPFNLGYVAVETAVQASSGIKVDPKINIESRAITRENMYTQENQELLFPMVEK